MWSGPPAEPPAQVTLAGSALIRASAEFRHRLDGESAGTAIACHSPVSRAIGVTWSSVTGDLLVMIAPTMTYPLAISWVGSPLAPFTNWAMPIVPPAPGTFVT